MSPQLNEFACTTAITGSLASSHSSVPIATHHHRIAALHLVFVRPECAAHHRVDTHHVEKVAAHQHAEFHLGNRVLIGRKSERAELRRRQPRERLAAARKSA